MNEFQQVFSIRKSNILSCIRGKLRPLLPTVANPAEIILKQKYIAIWSRGNRSSYTSCLTYLFLYYIFFFLQYFLNYIIFYPSQMLRCFSFLIFGNLYELRTCIINLLQSNILFITDILFEIFCDFISERIVTVKTINKTMIIQ